jgi:class 3 adenylate cyclase
MVRPSDVIVNVSAVARRNSDLRGESLTADTTAEGPVHRVHTGCDVESYSRLSGEAQRHVQSRLAAVHRTAVRRAGLSEDGAVVQNSGDGDLVRWPADVDVTKVSVDLCRELHAELLRINAALPEHERIRLRLAITAGYSEIAEYGLAGRAPITVARLLNADQGRRALHVDRDCPLVVIVDEAFYTDVVSEWSRGLHAADFVPIAVRDDGKDFTGAARLAVPGCDPVLLAGLAQAAPGRPSDRGNVLVLGTFGTLVLLLAVLLPFVLNRGTSGTPQHETAYGASGPLPGPPPALTLVVDRERPATAYADANRTPAGVEPIPAGTGLPLGCLEETGVYLVVGGRWAETYVDANALQPSAVRPPTCRDANPPPRPGRPRGTTAPVT